MGFDVCLEYDFDSVWHNVACVHHDERIHTNTPNIFVDGVCLQYYKDNQLYRQSTVQIDGDPNERPIEEYMKYAFQILEQRAPTIITRFEEWHEIKAH